jgi:hypothetical protein
MIFDILKAANAAEKDRFLLCRDSSQFALLLQMTEHYH